MFKSLREEIISLNKDVSNIASCEKAKKLRKKLLSIGLPLAIIGVIGVITCFILFATAGFNGFSENGFSARLIVPFCLFPIFGVIAGIGAYISALGFKILITDYTTNLADSVVGNNCPECGDKIENDEEYCTKCGTQLKKICSNCKTINSTKDTYCKKCGKKLDE